MGFFANRSLSLLLFLTRHIPRFIIRTSVEMDALSVQTEMPGEIVVAADILDGEVPCIAHMRIDGQRRGVIDPELMGALIIDRAGPGKYRCVVHEIHGIMVNGGEGVIAGVFLLPGQGSLFNLLPASGQ